MVRALVLAFVLTLTGPAMAHDSRHPELNEWMSHLQAKKHGLCCDFSEVTRIEDPDWTTDPSYVEGGCKQTIQGEREGDGGHYCVRLNGIWWLVPTGAEVDDPNKAGMALVWPVYVGAPGHEQLIAIRCFMAGAQG